MLTSNVPGLPKPLRLRSGHLGALRTLGNARKASGAQRCEFVIDLTKLHCVTTFEVRLTKVIGPDLHQNSEVLFGLNQ